MSELETKIRNVIKAWRNVTRSISPAEDESAMEDALLDLESLLDRPALNTEPPEDDHKFSKECFQNRCDECESEACWYWRPPASEGRERK